MTAVVLGAALSAESMGKACRILICERGTLVAVAHGGPMPTIRLRTGIDLVFIPDLARLAAERAFLERAFQPDELVDGRAEHLAGVLAAKEAFFKALGRTPDWLAVEVVPTPSGRPSLRLGGSLSGLAIQDLDLSISHDGEYAVAAVVLLLGEEPAP